MGSRPNHPVNRPRCGLLLRLFVTMTVFGASLAVADPKIEPLDHFPTSTVTVAAGTQKHRFTVWLATTPERHEQGLMFVKKLPPDRGMLFVFEEADLRAFWMKNTLIPLDILFIGPDGRIVRIAQNAKPLSLDPISSFGLATEVLELAGGECEKRGIHPGDRVSHASTR